MWGLRDEGRKLQGTGLSGEVEGGQRRNRKLCVQYRASENKPACSSPLLWITLCYVLASNILFMDCIQVVC